MKPSSSPELSLDGFLIIKVILFKSGLGNTNYVLSMKTGETMCAGEATGLFLDA
jgi:hypothetical protein